MEHRANASMDESRLRENMDDGTNMQFPLLAGPTGVPWILNTNFSRSAEMLMDVHRRTAFDECYKRNGQSIYASYGRRLGAAIGRRWDSEKRMAELCKKTRRTFYSGDEKFAQVVLVYAEALEYLGELHRAIVRCVENEINLTGTVQDLRSTEPSTINAILDSRQVPQTNEMNPYCGLSLIPALHVTLQSKWLRQDDPQIDRYHDLLGVTTGHALPSYAQGHPNGQK